VSCTTHDRVSKFADAFLNLAALTQPRMGMPGGGFTMQRRRGNASRFDEEPSAVEDKDVKKRTAYYQKIPESDFAVYQIGVSERIACTGNVAWMPARPHTSSLRVDSPRHFECAKFVRPVSLMRLALHTTPCVTRVGRGVSSCCMVTKFAHNRAGPTAHPWLFPRTHACTHVRPPTHPLAHLLPPTRTQTHADFHRGVRDRSVCVVGERRLNWQQSQHGCGR
jgi:hypothetical protein